MDHPPPKNFRTDSSGATAVEFALLAPAALALMFAVFEGGRLIWTWSSLQYAVQDAARCASVQTATCSDATATENYAASRYFAGTPPAGTFTASLGQACGNLVRASFSYSPSIPFAALPSVTLTTQACNP